MKDVRTLLIATAAFIVIMLTIQVIVAGHDAASVFTKSIKEMQDGSRRR